jgi:hypothetical protein
VSAPYQLTLVLDLWTWERQKAVETQEAVVERLGDVWELREAKLRETRLEERQREPLPTVEKPEWIRRVRLDGGDVLVFQVNEQTTEEMIKRIAEQARAAFPGHEVVVLGGRVELEIVGGDEDEQRARSA